MSSIMSWSMDMLPTQSMVACTFTPARARSDSAAANVLCDAAGPVDVGFEIHGPFGPADGFEHRRKDLLAVFQVGDLVAGKDGGAQQHAHFPLELGICDRIAMLYLALELFLGCREIQAKDDDKQRDERSDDNRPQGSPAAPSIRHGDVPLVTAANDCRQRCRRREARVSATMPRQTGRSWPARASVSGRPRIRFPTMSPGRRA